jgi:hypothetical protein
MDYGFIQHCIEKNQAPQYLHYTPRFLADLHPNSKVNRIYGLHMTRKIKEHCVTNIINYMEEVIDIVRDEQGNEIGKVLGVKRILDPLLLQEMRRFEYEPPRGQEHDRVIAFGLALAYAQELNKTVGTTQSKKDIYQYYGNKNKTKSMFGNLTIKNPFRTRS